MSDMYNPYNAASYEKVAAILRDSNIRLEQLGRGEYGKLISAVGSDNFDFSLKKNAEGFYIMESESDSPPEPECPPWIPASLCVGYSAISKFGKNVGMGPFAMQMAAGDLAVEKLKEWSLDNKDTFIQIGIFIVGAALITVAIVFLLKDTVAKEVIGKTLKSVVSE